MATSVRIQCVTANSSRTITHVGGKGTDGSNWKLSVEEVIRRITNRTHRYYVMRNGKETDVEVVDGKYLRTRADNSTGNNLSDLHACPA